MKRLPALLSILSLAILFVSCKHKTTQENTKDTQASTKKAYRRNIKANVKLICYDQYTYEKGNLSGALIGPNIIAAPFDKIKEAYSIRSILLGKDVKPMMNGYYYYDIPGNLVLLKISGPPLNHPKLATHTSITEKVYRLGLESGKTMKHTYSCDSSFIFNKKTYYRIKGQIESGTPLFNSKHLLAGVSTSINLDDKKTNVLIPAQELSTLLKQLPAKVERLAKLRFKSDKVYPAPSAVDHFEIVSDKGNFSIRISDELPEYQKNFIRLVSDGYYDSLLIHRVLHKFLVQMGAADTKYAKKDDPVGWKGPGYTLPTKILPNLFHRRGAVAASKLPDYKNPHNRSDGSQFYVVCGRTFTNEELDEIEEQKGITFSKTQREVYQSIGGAPYLDGEYTVFGEVIKGMSVIDKISELPIGKDDRPLIDIRIKHINIIMK